MRRPSDTGIPSMAGRGDSRLAASQGDPRQRRRLLRHFGLPLWLVLSAPVSLAQTPSPAGIAALEKVEVSGESQAERDRKTLGDFADAEALFSRFRALAPQAELRFRALTRLDRSQSERLNIQVLAPGGRIDVLLDELSRFRLDPAWRALPASTVLRSKLFDGHVAWRSDVRTPGLPANVRRLGDLRLQCKLDWGTPLGRRGLVPTLVTITPAAGLCESRFTGALNSQFADFPVLAIDLVHGGRRERLSYFFLHGAGDNTPTKLISGALDWSHGLKDYTYRLPLQDESWPDDTQVEFTFMDPLAVSGDEAKP